MKRVLACLFVVLMAACSAKTGEIQSAPHREITVRVNGAVCGFCSYGIRKEISKLPFVDTTKYENGIRTNSEEQSVTIAVLPGESVDEEVLRNIVIEAGYETVSIEHNER